MPMWMHLLAAAVFNVMAVYCLKLSEGMTRLWPSLGVVVLIVATQWLVARAMVSGAPVASAITAVVVAVMVGSALVGAAFGERPNAWQLFGYAFAIVGVVLASVKTSAS